MDNFISRLKISRKKHPIFWNLLYIFVAFFVLGYIALCFLDVWTHHGSTTRVPQVVGMNYVAATRALEEADLKVIVADSVYNKTMPPGSVVDVVPQQGAVVKSGREVYITIVAFSPEPIIIDLLLTDMSGKQAEAYLKSKGLRVEKIYVPSQYPDLVVGVKCKGRPLSVGSQVTVNDIITLEIGQFEEPEITDIDELDLMIEAAIGMDSVVSSSRVEPAAEVESRESTSEHEVTPEQHVKNIFGN